MANLKIDKNLLTFIVSLFAIIFGGSFLLSDISVETEKVQTTTFGEFVVINVIDGDTVKLQNGEKVRLLGINTPERGQAYYKEATEKLEELVLNREVLLTKDVQNRDRYGRLLRYVYVDDLFVNKEMVRSGYANSYAYPPNTSLQEEIFFAEDFARNERVGLWKLSIVVDSIAITDLNYDAEGADGDNLNDEYVRLKNISSSTLVLTDWVLKDLGSNIYVFPEVSLASQEEIFLFTGSGIDGGSGLYWGSSNPIWNNDGDTLFLRDEDGLFVLEYLYE